MLMGNSYIGQSIETRESRWVDTVDSHKQTRTMTEFTTRVNRCVRRPESDYEDVSVYKYERREGATVTILTIVIFVDEWHPVTEESTRDIQ